jgi:hypothetical protein
MENKEYEEALWRIYNCNDDDYTLGYRQHDYRLLQQALTTKSEKEQALEIIVKKNVNVGLVSVIGDVERYNETYVYENMLNVKWALTESEFDLVSKVVKEITENESK